MICPESLMEAPVSGFTNAPLNSTFSRSRIGAPAPLTYVVRTWLTVQTPCAWKLPQSKYSTSTGLVHVSTWGADAEAGPAAARRRPAARPRPAMRRRGCTLSPRMSAAEVAALGRRSRRSAGTETGCAPSIAVGSTLFRGPAAVPTMADHATHRAPGRRSRRLPKAGPRHARGPGLRRRRRGRRPAIRRCGSRSPATRRRARGHRAPRPRRVRGRGRDPRGRDRDAHRADLGPRGGRLRGPRRRLRRRRVHPQGGPRGGIAARPASSVTPRQLARVGLLVPVVAVAFAMLAYAKDPSLSQDPFGYLFDASTGVILVAAGLVAWDRRPAWRTGPLLIVAGYWWYVGSLYELAPPGSYVPFLGYAFRGYYDVSLAFVVLAVPR